MRAFQSAITAIVLCLGVAIGIVGDSRAAQISSLGEQDFANGAVLLDTQTWVDAQANEGSFFTAIYVTPGPLVFTHTGLDTGQSGILTVALWDADVRFAGEQQAPLLFDGVPQSVAPFEAFAAIEQEGEIRHYQFFVDQSFLSDGELVVSIAINEPPAGNNLGIDFSRLELVQASIPEPGSLPLVLGSIIGVAALRRRRATAP